MAPRRTRAFHGEAVFKGPWPLARGPKDPGRDDEDAPAGLVFKDVMLDLDGALDEDAAHVGGSRVPKESEVLLVAADPVARKLDGPRAFRQS